MIVLVLAGGAFIISLGVTALVRRYTVRAAVLDWPNARSLHRQPTPRGGGLGFMCTTVATIFVLAALGVTEARDAAALGVGMAIVGAAGWADDRHHVHAAIRLCVHIIAAAWTVWLLGGFREFLVGGVAIRLGGVGAVLAVVGIVWSINLFNFMDGIDGLAGSQAVLILGCVAVLLVYVGSHSLGTIAALGAGAAAGFLVWNWPPAKIFMGDAGSGTLGYLIAALAVASENRHAVPMISFAIIGGLFITDATVTLLRRFIRGCRPMEAHRDHAYQRLARQVGSHRAVTLAAAAVTLVLAVMGTAAAIDANATLWSALAAVAFLAILMIAAERRAPM